MTENGIFLSVEDNENQSGLRISTGNDFLYVTADSDILNITDELANHSFQESENANYVHPSDSNFNVVGVTDMSLSEHFQRMKLSSDTSTPLGSEREIASFPESTATLADNQSEEVPSPLPHDFLPQEIWSRSVLKETLSSPERNNLPILEANNLNISKETLPSEKNSLQQNEASNHHDSKETLPSEKNSLQQNEASNHHDSKETLTTPEETALPKQNSDDHSISDGTLHCHEIDSLPSSQNSIKENFVSPTLGQDVCSNILGDDSLLPEGDTCEVLNSCLPVITTMEDICNDLSDCADGQDIAVFINESGKPKLQEGSLEIPNSVVFTDFKSIDSSSGSVDQFEVPEVPKEDEEGFADAVQFFKDPSSLNFLENIVTSGSSESAIPRSSLYLAFDPLHSKIMRGSQMQVVQLRQSEIGVEEVSKTNSLPVAVSARESMGNILISFDSPRKANKTSEERDKGSATLSISPKLYTEEQLQRSLKIHELTLQEMHLKQQRDLEQELQKTKEDSGATIKKLNGLYNALQGTLEELLGVLQKLAEDKKELQEKMMDLEKENYKLKEDLKTSTEDLQSVENTFSDFHKRYEQSKAMLKSYKDNEVHLKEEFTNMAAKLSEKEHEYNVLQERTKELLEKGNTEVANSKKSSEGQVMVLKAQLKKAELKISGLEGDIKRIKIENSQLGGICDDLMDKVSKS